MKNGYVLSAESVLICMSGLESLLYAKPELLLDLIATCRDLENEDLDTPESLLRAMEVLRPQDFTSEDLRNVVLCAFSESAPILLLQNPIDYIQPDHEIDESQLD